MIDVCTYNIEKQNHKTQRAPANIVLLDSDQHVRVFHHSRTGAASQVLGYCTLCKLHIDFDLLRGVQACLFSRINSRFFCQLLQKCHQAFVVNVCLSARGHTVELSPITLSPEETAGRRAHLLDAVPSQRQNLEAFHSRQRNDSVYTVC